MLKVMLVLGLIFGATSLFAGQSAMQCVSVQTEGKKTYFRNSCSQKVTIAFCSSNKRINGKMCGDGGKPWNKYYTQMFALDGGDKVYRYDVGRVEYAVCLGFINGWSTEGKFSSDYNGNFGCHN